MLTTQSVDSARHNESAYGNQPCSDFQQCLQTAKTAGARNQAGAPPQNHNDQTVTVKSGDTLWGIAQQHGTSLGALLAANPLVAISSAAGYDVLRSPWFYRHSVLGSLRLRYPGPAELAVIDAILLLLPLLPALAWRRLTVYPKTHLETLL